MRKKFTGSGLQIWLAHRGGRLTTDLLVDGDRRIYVAMRSALGDKRVYLPIHLYGDNLVDNILKGLIEAVDKRVDSKGTKSGQNSGP